MPHAAKPPAFDPATMNLIDQLMDSAKVGADPAQREQLGEMIRAALQLGSDGAGTGEIKLVSRSFRELRHALNIFRPFAGRRKVSMFGSARTPPDHPDYACARDFSRALAGRGWMTVTGAGPGIMAAGNEGAGQGNSFGLSIRLPWETNGNEFLRGDPKLIYFRYFFTRKLIFAMGADAMAVFPGGFGTMDECFELLTLMQTGKSALIPVVLLAPPGNPYWKEFREYLENHLVANKWIDEKDLFLFKSFSDVDAAAAHVEHFYRNYHSYRFVGDRLVIRIRRPLTEAELAELNSIFAVICTQGGIEQGPAFQEEDELLELPRLMLHFNRKDFSILRMLIDTLNDFG
ncbi:MAG TPA: LOG family protein [Fibrobacteria bacterium]|nr:LOG family protein [Fibrobacteria bacterium]